MNEMPSDKNFNRRMNIMKRIKVTVTVVSFFVLASISLTSCANNPYQTNQVPIEQTAALTTATETKEPSPAPSETQEPSPTPTETQEPTPTQTQEPLIEGDISIFLEDAEQKEKVESFLKIQEIINNYSSNSGLDFEEYITNQINSLQGDSDFDAVVIALEEMKELKNENKSIAFVRAIKKAFPELGILDVSPWPENVIDITGADLSLSFSNELNPGYLVGGYIYNGVEILGDIPLSLYFAGDLTFKLDEYTFEYKQNDVDLIVCLGTIEINGQTYLLIGTRDNHGEIIYSIVDEENEDEIFGQTWRYLLGIERSIR